MRKNWKIIEEKEIKKSKEYLTDLKNSGYVTSPWIENIFLSKEYSNIKNKKFYLSRYFLSEIGFLGPTKLKDIYERFYELNLGLVYPILSLILRLNYNEQSKGEWLRIAVPFDSMIDADGVPHLPKLGHALNKFFIETYWSYPEAIFHPHNEFVVLEKEEETK